MYVDSEISYRKDPNILNIEQRPMPPLKKVLPPEDLQISSDELSNNSPDQMLQSIQGGVVQETENSSVIYNEPKHFVKN